MRMSCRLSLSVNNKTVNSKSVCCRWSFRNQIFTLINALSIVFVWFRSIFNVKTTTETLLDILKDKHSYIYSLISPYISLISPYIPPCGSKPVKDARIAVICDLQLLLVRNLAALNEGGRELLDWDRREVCYSYGGGKKCLGSLMESMGWILVRFLSWRRQLYIRLVIFSSKFFSLSKNISKTMSIQRLCWRLKDVQSTFTCDVQLTSFVSSTSVTDIWKTSCGSILKFLWRSNFSPCKAKLQSGFEPLVFTSVTCMRHVLYQVMYLSALLRTFWSSSLGTLA